MLVFLRAHNKCYCHTQPPGTMRVSLRDITHQFGTLPKMNRLSGPVAQVVASALESMLPDLTNAAAKVLAQHLWYYVQHGEPIGSMDAFANLAQRLQIQPHQIMAAPALVSIVRNNEPLSAFIAVARKVSAAQRRAEKKAYYGQANGSDTDSVRQLQTLIAAAAQDPSGAGFGDFFKKAFKGVSSAARGAVDLASNVASSDLGRDVGRQVIQSSAQRGLQQLSGQNVASARDVARDIGRDISQNLLQKAIASVAPPAAAGRRTIYSAFR